MYFPKDNSNTTDLVDVGKLGCNGLDQRGIMRIASSTTNGSGINLNSCDIGATELLKLTANNISDANVSLVDLIKFYQQESDLFKGLLDNKETNVDFLPFYKIQYDLYQNKIKNTNAVKLLMRINEKRREEKAAE